MRIACSGRAFGKRNVLALVVRSPGTSPDLQGWLRVVTDSEEASGGKSTTMRKRPQQSLWSRFSEGIGARLLVRVLLFSSAITLILTVLQLYLDYRRDVGIIKDRLAEIERSYIESIGESLWQLDERQLVLQLEGILRLPDIRAVEVREATNRPAPLVVAVGERQSNAALAREVPIMHSVRGAMAPIGSLYVEATLDEVYRALLDKALVILVSQGAKTFLVSLFIVYIFHRLVTRHLTAIAATLRSVPICCGRRRRSGCSVRRNPSRTSWTSWWRPSTASPRVCSMPTTICAPPTASWKRICARAAGSRPPCARASSASATTR